MKPGDLVRINYGAPGFRDELHGEIGIIIRRIERNAYAVLVAGQQVHFHKHVLEPVNETHHR